jgi:hypothetical protein
MVNTALHKRVFVFRNEPHLHSAAATVQATKKLKIDPPPPSHTHTHTHTHTHAHTPPIQSNLAALDYHMFGLLNKPCLDKFASDCEVKDTMHTWLGSQ